MFFPRGLKNHWALLLGSDFAISAATCYTAFGWTANPVAHTVADRLGASLTLSAFYLAALYFQDLYRLDEPRPRMWLAAATLNATLKMAVVVSILAFAFPGFAYGRRFYVVYLGSAGVLLAVWRVGINGFIADRLNLRVMALGMGECAVELLNQLNRRRHLGYRFVGFALWEGASAPNAALASKVSEPAVFRLPSRPFALRDLLRMHNIRFLVILDQLHHPGSIRELLQCRLVGIRIFDFESFYEQLTGRLPVSFLREEWMLFSPGFRGRRFSHAVKRAADLLAATAIAIVTAPVTLVAAIAIKLDSPGPVIYSQERVGLNGKTFRVYKLRTMYHRDEASRGPIAAAAGDPRVTRVGRILRKHRIDELPQLFNVLRGDMSLVGPRPRPTELEEELVRELPFYDCRYLVRPGLTGWAQICHPYGATVEDHCEMLCYDLYYVKNCSLTFDLQIILQTIKVTLFGRGAR